MLKRAFSYIIGAEKQVARDYERWSRSQLIQRIRELESSAEVDKDETKENTPASEIVSTPAPDASLGSATVANSTNKTSKKKKFDFSTQNQRFIALRFAYAGWNYSGLAFQNEPTPLPTVEEEILKALSTAKLIAAPDPHCCDFSRCGRTDKGVSALNQVISLKVRSRLSKEEQELKTNDSNEIPYVTVLNTLLPKDIRVTAVCLRPPEDFDARFSCDYRHYKYIFKKDGLDLELMEQAAAKYLGPHDFRNFCKIDGSKQITNYGRTVLSSSIQHLRDDYYVFDLKGTAFLWHQVRCMVAILFLVGQKHESVDIIDKLLDVTTMPSKPIYDLANDIPLVLYDCVFPEMEWVAGIDETKASKILRDNAIVKGLVTEVQIKAMITEMVANLALTDETGYKNLPGSGIINIGDGRGRNFKKYVKIVNREYGDTFEVVNAKHREKKRRKLESNDSINE
ncbi:tRNA pseudouridine(38/39) synthase [[Candida] railenensis]|uniref:tRNA pseudouridine(38/39) synthase n=1 Tax=[Candida] railenensis TaxID=45579 RepID=A0A9P0VX53_9ASCO|nr:tRNA pseudouridine(38/39) synthase [[Candida] railenensis]